MAQIRVLSPVGVVKAQTVAVPSLPQSWNGRTVGFLDNTKSTMLASAMLTSTRLPPAGINANAALGNGRFHLSTLSPGKKFCCRRGEDSLLTVTP